MAKPYKLFAAWFVGREPTKVLNGLPNSLALPLVALLALSACATPRMHSKQELSAVEVACNLSTGELVQEDELKKVLFLYRVGPTPAERACVRKWARKNHLHVAYIDAINWTDK